jgi:RND superfamily putative drug exporter
MNRTLDRLGRFSASHPWRALALWAVVLTAVIGLAATLGGPTQENWNVDNARAQKGIEQLREHLPAAGNASAQVVVHDDAVLDQGTLSELGDDLAGLDHVLTVSPPRMSADGDTALVTVAYDVPVTHRDLMGKLEPLEDAVAPYRDAGLQVELGGELPGTAAAPMEGRGELIGIIAALLILLLMFRSVVAAGLPVVVAVLGLGLGLTGVTVLCGVMDVSPTAPTVAAMVGLGVGIDYALLMLTRILEHVRAGEGFVDAAAHAATTAGRSVVLAGTTVLVSLLGLKLSGVPTLEAFGFTTAIAVVAVMFTALVLVPAIGSLFRTRLTPRAVRRGRTSRPAGLRAERWARRIAGRPVPWLLAAATLMLVLAAPVLDMRTWPQSGGDGIGDTTTRRAFDLVSSEIGAGANAPLQVVVDLGRTGQQGVADVTRTLEGRDDVATVAPPVVSSDGEIAVVGAESAYADNDPRSAELVSDLRAELPDGVEVTGNLALFADIADLLAVRLWLVIGFVVLISVVLLTMMFRSVAVPLKAAVMNLLSVGAAYGVLTVVFQWGWGLELLGIDHARPISSWLPILMFTVLFGLSMDYEVFLLSRVKEDYDLTGDPHGSVARGLASTSRVITAAAAIMVMVFFGFVTEMDALIRMLGFGMGVAILLDATIVRMVLVPATMSLLGHWNWWLPAWLDRVLPRLDPEGHGHVAAAAVPPSREDELEHVG